jgi:hydrogenase maturation protein HypF
MSMQSTNVMANTAAYRVRVTGHVQGVGFRPFVKRLADDLGLTGSVSNDSNGVFIEIEGEPSHLDALLLRLRGDAPETVRIETVTTERMDCIARETFEILLAPRARLGAGLARAPRDRAVCDECLNEFRDPVDRRHQYAFTTCTTCGPRYTVLKSMPYERGGTSMSDFPLCDICAREFVDVDDRRFHAEVMACSRCGPQVDFQDMRSSHRETGDVAIDRAADALTRGDIVALKGLGGFQLLARADDAATVARLRARKHRPSKPLAVMVRSYAEATRYAHLDADDREWLESPENPIVLVRQRHDAALFAGIAPNLNQVGVLLPTTPLHHRLLEHVSFPVVATSGNRREEPILADDATATDLGVLADVALTHNRPIVRRLDDSVLRVIAGKASVIRLARGFAPHPLTSLERWLDRLGSDRPTGGVLALGGQQKNAVALWTGRQAILGPHFGDLESGRARSVWRRHLKDLAGLFGAEIQTLITDLHPDYAAYRWAERSGLPMVKVAHHHAHAAAAMVEHNLLDRTVLALTWDGTGLGPGGELWGGECLRASLTDFQRIAALRPLRLPGGEAAIRQPWRIGVALLNDALGDVNESLWADISFATVRGIRQLLDRQIQCSVTTSLGRLFDGVASLLLGVSHVTYEGEAATWMESIADPAIDDSYPVEFENQDGLLIWDWRPVVRSMVADRNLGVPTAICSTRFHNSIARWAQIVASTHSESDIVLSGGCFQNALLTDRVGRGLETIGKRVHRPGIIPVNDGGLAAGQLAVGLARPARQS